MAHKRPILSSMFIAHRTRHRRRRRFGALGSKFGAEDRPGFDERRRSLSATRFLSRSHPPQSVSPSTRRLAQRGLVCVCDRAPWRSRSPRPSSPSSPARARRCPPATAGSTSPSGTASARSRSSTATTSTCSRATASRCARYFPELALPRRPLRARRRDRAVRRAGPPGLRRARPAHPPGGVAHPHARRADADALRRLRPARARTTRCCSSCRRPSAATASSSSSTRRSTSRPRPTDPDGAQPWLQGAEGVIAKRQDAPVPARRARRHGEDQARAHDRRRRHGLAPRQGGGHGRLADPRPLRRGRASCARSATPRASAPKREARAASPSWRPTRPASAGRATRAAGPTTASSSGSSCGPSWSSRSPSTTRATTASATARRSLRWREDKAPADCPMDQLAVR